MASVTTSSYFDDKTPEEIINWMLDKLTDDQIKTCLDQAGIPGTDAIRRPEEPDPVVPVLPEAPGGSGSGSGFEPGPSTTMELDQLRRSCKNRLVLIENVSGSLVSFYEFGPDGAGDLKWERNELPVSNFLESTCNEEKISSAVEILDLDPEEKEEMAPGLVRASDVPEDVKRLASEYLMIELLQPLDPSLLDSPDISEPEPSVVYDAAVSEAIMKQVTQSIEDDLKKKFPELYSAGMTKIPVFAHSVSGDGKISYISLILNDDNSFSFKERTNGPALFITQAKKYLKELNSKIETAVATGMPRPSDYAEILDTALSTWSSKNPANQEIYNKILVNYNPVRLTQLKNSITTAFGEMAYNEYNSEVPEMNTYFSGAKPSPVPDATNKNVRDLDINELRTRMITLFGKDYAETHDPFIAYNKFGIKTVQYRKKTGPKPDLDARNWTRDDVPVFDEFGTETEDFDLF